MTLPTRTTSPAHAGRHVRGHVTDTRPASVPTSRAPVETRPAAPATHGTARAPARRPHLHRVDLMRVVAFVCVIVVHVTGTTYPFPGLGASFLQLVLHATRAAFFFLSTLADGALSGRAFQQPCQALLMEKTAHFSRLLLGYYYTDFHRLSVFSTVINSAN